MVRPKPCALFAQSFFHHTLGEYVDEVRFTEPVIICACEFLELHASSLCPTLSLSGATFPQSFALEIFIRVGGEARFKRLSPAFLYSPSASSVLDVQAVMTDHLVIRGSYRTLSLIIYGNSAKELGQFNVDHDIDSTLSGLILPAETVFKPEDLPEALQEEPKCLKKKVVSSLKSLQLVYRDPEQLLALQGLLSIAVEISRSSSGFVMIRDVFDILLSAVSTMSVEHAIEGLQLSSLSKFSSRSQRKIRIGLKQAKDQIQGIADKIDVGPTKEALDFGIVVETVSGWIQRGFALTSAATVSNTSAEEFLMGGLAAVQLLCMDARWCFEFVVAGGMHLLVSVLQFASAQSSATVLLVLEAIQCACQYAFACEALLGWWPGPAVPSENMHVNFAYCAVLRILMQTKRTKMLQLAFQVIQHLCAYELASEFQCEVESLLQQSAHAEKMEGGKGDEEILKRLSLSLKKLMNTLSVRDFPYEWSPAEMTNWLLLDGDEFAVSVSPSMVFNWIASSKYSFTSKDLNPRILAVLLERHFIPCLSAMLSTPWMIAVSQQFQNSFLELIGNVQTLIMALISSRSGLIFLASDHEATVSLIAGLQGFEEAEWSEFMSPRYACSLVAAGFICKPCDVGQMLHTSLSMTTTLDNLMTASRQSESFLWLLWELSVFSRSEGGRQFLSCISYFPEVLSIIIEALQPDSYSLSVEAKEIRALKRAVLHSAAEIMQVILTDPVTASLAAWIPHAVSLQKALQYCSPTTIDLAVGNHGLGLGSKDALCARLLDWVDAGVLFCRKGPVGLLRYAAALVVGSVTSVAVGGLPSSDGVEPEGLGESAMNTEFPTVSTLLGRGVTLGASGTLLPDTAVIQLTVSLRIMAAVSCHSGVAAVLYGEGAMAILYILLEYAASVLQSSSTDYDYIVEEDGEADEIMEIFLEQEREQSLLALLLPSLLLLLSLLKRLQCTGEAYRNTRLVEILVQLHRCICARMASKVTIPARAGGMLLLGSTSRVIASILSYWPVYGWTPSFFPKLLLMPTASSTPASCLFPMEPKESLSMLWLLGDMLPEESPELQMGMISVADISRSLAVSTLLGVNSMHLVGWHCHAPNCQKLVLSMRQHIDHLASMVFHLASTTSTLLRALLIKFLVRMACQSQDNVAALLSPVLTFIRESTCGGASAVDGGVFQVERFLETVIELAKHPVTKKVLLQKDIVQVLLQSITSKQEFASRNYLLLLIFQIIVTVCDPKISVVQDSSTPCCFVEDHPGFKDYCSAIAVFLKHLLSWPVSKDLQVLAECVHSIVSSQLGRAAFACVALWAHKKTGGPFSSMDVISTTEFVEKLLPDLAVALGDDAGSFLLFCKRMTAALSEGVDSLVVADVLHTFTLSAIELAAAGRSACGLGALQLLFEVDKMESRETLDLLVRTLKAKADGADADSEKLSYSKVLKSITVLVRILENLPAIMFLEKKIRAVMDSVSSRQICKEDEYSKDKVTQNWKLFPELLCERREDKSVNGDEGDVITEDKTWKDSFTWECAEDSSEKSVPGGGIGKRKPTGFAEGVTKKLRAESGGSGPALELSANLNGNRATGISSSSASGTNRRDTFRQRKPNTSRPPSMHVDDYIAREKGNEITTAGSVQRGISSSGRPPSVHVDEFMARQRDKQHVIGSSVSVQSHALAAPITQGEVKVEITATQFARVKPLLAEDDLEDVDIEIEGVPDAIDLLPLPIVDEIVSHSGKEDCKDVFKVELHVPDSASSSKLPVSTDETTISHTSFVHGGVHEPGFVRTALPNTLAPTLQGNQPTQQSKEGMLPIGMAVQLQDPVRASVDIYPPHSVPEHRSTVPVDFGNFNITVHPGAHVQFTSVQPVPPPLPPPPPIPVGVVPEKCEVPSNADQHPFVLSLDGQQKPGMAGPSFLPLFSDYHTASTPGMPIAAMPPAPPPPPPSIAGGWQASVPGTPMNTVTTLGGPAALPGHLSGPLMGTGTVIPHLWQGTPLFTEDNAVRLPAPPLPPTPPPLSSIQAPVMQAPPMPHLPPPYGQSVGRMPAAEGRPVFTYPSFVDATAIDKRFTSFSQQPLVAQPPVPPSPSILPSFQPPLPPGRPILQSQAVPAAAAQQFQGITSQPSEPVAAVAHPPPFQQQLLQASQMSQQQQPPVTQQQQESGKLLQQILASPDAIENLLKDQTKLQILLEQHPKLISLLQEKMGQG